MPEEFAPGSELDPGAESQGSGAPTAEPDPLDTKIQLLEAQLAQAKDSMLRALADLQNYKKRSLSEIDRARNALLASIAFRLVPISDNLNRTLAAAEDGASRESLLEGVRIVGRQLKDALDELRVEKISAVGAVFDPALHEAIAMEHHELPSGTVIEEIESGFTVGKELLRPSKVKVSKGPKE